MKNVLVIHGPNLNLLGERDPAFYGNVTFDKLNEMILEQAEALGLHCEIFQSNHEGAIIDKLQAARKTMDGVVINAGAYTHYSYAIHDAIADIQDVIPVTEVTGDYIELEAHPNATGLEKELRGRALYNHITTATRETAMARFKALKAGENFHNLDPELKTTYSNADRTQNTIYMRLKYNEPSSTVVNVRKSMWIHPELDRAISIREAARLQTFPDSFIFEGTKDSQYQQVGNAVPPYLAKAIADSVISILNNAAE